MKSLEPSGYGETFASWVSRLRADCSRRQKSARAMSASASSFSAWLTPSANEDAAGTVDGKMQRMVTHQAKEVSDLLWSTPRASDGEKGGPNQSFGAGGMPLPAQTVMWSTPSVADVTGGRKARSGDRSDEPLMNGQAEKLVERLNWPTPTSLSYADSHQPGNSQSMNITLDLASSLRDQMTYPVGEIPSKERRSLNPLFVEWLMGWPPGWTLLAWTDLGCSATALYLWREAMRSELLRIGLPHEAPPAQMSLFG